MKTLILVTSAAAVLLSLTGQMSAAIGAAWTFAIVAGIFVTRKARS